MKEGTSKEHVLCTGFFYFEKKLYFSNSFVDCWYIHSLTCLSIVCACAMTLLWSLENHLGLLVFS